MKNLKTGILTAIGIGILVLLGMLVHTMSVPKTEQEPPQEIEEIIDSLEVGKFIMSFKDAVSLQLNMQQTHYSDSVFMSMPYRSMLNVVQVLLKHDTAISQDDIVCEYIAHKEIYDNVRAETQNDSTTMQPSSSANSKQTASEEVTANKDSPKDEAEISKGLNNITDKHK